MNIGLIPLISTIVALVCGVTVLDQYFARRKPFQLIWAIGFFIYGISTLAEFYTEIYGLRDIVFRFWFFTGAICVAAYLGQGTVYLLLSRRTANISMAILLILTVLGAVRLFSADIDFGTAQSLTDSIKKPVDISILTGVLNLYGTVALVGGAIYSAWIYWRKKILHYRVVSNVLIAVGALLPAIGGSLLTVGAARGAVFYLFELAGVIIIFNGILRTKEIFGFFRFPLIHGFAQVKDVNHHVGAIQRPDRPKKDRSK